MHAASLFLTLNEARDPEIQSKMDGELPAIDAEGARYLDGHELYFGTAADYVEEEIQKVHIDHGKITTSREAVINRKMVEFYADVSTDPGFIGVSSDSDGEWLVKRIAAKTGVEVMETRIDVDAFAEQIRQEAEAPNAWNVSHTQDYGGGMEETTIDYHRSADLDSATDGTIGLGFEYFWDDTRVEGIVYESGYVALYSDTISEVFGAWVRQEVLPHLYVPDEGEETDQDTLTEDEQDRADVAATDGGDGGSLDDLKTVNDPSGGEE